MSLQNNMSQSHCFLQTEQICYTNRTLTKIYNTNKHNTGQHSNPESMVAKYLKSNSAHLITLADSMTTPKQTHKQISL